MSYWQHQTATVVQLQELGFKFKLKDRIPIFKVWERLRRMEAREPDLSKSIDVARHHLDILLEYRKNGMEPKLKTPTTYE